MLSAKSGGCNGYNYLFKPIKYKTFNDYDIDKSAIIEKDDIKITIDPMAEIYLLGTTVDYIEEDYIEGIFESNFKFIPDDDFASSCGCGISFSPKDINY